MDITKYMHMKNRHCSHIFLSEGSSIAPRGHEGSITFKLYDLLVAGGLFRAVENSILNENPRVVSCCILKVTIFVLIRMLL